MDLTWRALEGADIADVIAIAEIVHPGYPEDAHVLLERLKLYPAGCFALVKQNAVVGYVLSHPWMSNAIPKLNTLLEHLPEAADTYYLHDIALLPIARGYGVAGDILGHLYAIAVRAGFETISLCAVNASEPFWQRHGFVILRIPEMENALASYGMGAAHMVREIS